MPRSSGQANRVVAGYPASILGQPGPARSKRAWPEWRRDLDRTEKQEFVAELASVFAETSMVVVTQNQGLTVAE